MLDPQNSEPQPNADLVWMLLSSQVDRRHLIHKLVDEFYQPLYRQALEKLLDPEQAQRAIQRTLAAIVIHAHRFGARQDLDEWIHGLFDREIRRTQRRQLLRNLFLRKTTKYPAEPADDLTQIPDPAQSALLIAGVEQAIRSEQRRAKTVGALQWGIILSLALVLLFYLGWSEDWSLPASEPSQPVANTHLVTHIVPITPIPSSTPSPTGTLIPTSLPQTAVLYIVKPGDTLAEIAKRTGVDVTILAALNGLQRQQVLKPGQKIIVAFGQVPQVMITPTLVTPVPTRQALNEQSSPEEIIQRVRDSDRSWNTLWLDAQIIDYGPAGYIGLPLAKREQVWLLPNQQGMYLSGKEGNAKPERITLSLNGMEYSYQPGETIPLINSTAGAILNYTQILQLFNSPFTEEMPYRLEINGIEKIAGRQALTVDYYSVEGSGEYYFGRYSLDVHTGIPLRLLTYADATRQTLSQEIRITDIRYDQNFPPELLDPFSGAITHFAQGPDGEQQENASLAARLQGVNAFAREPLPHLSPPPDFDPTQSQLLFQFPTLIRLGGARDLAEIFASEYYLGTLEFADPWNINCSRSPNGRYIAFFSYLDAEPYRSSLHWIDLLNPTELHSSASEVLPSWANLAFSPDSRQIAFIACRQLDNDCTIYALDLESVTPQALIDVGGSSSIAWSPDGREIAFLGSLASNSDWLLHVFDVQTGEITYSGPMDWETNTPANPGAPVNSWGVTFPNWNTGLEACTAPPE